MTSEIDTYLNMGYSRIQAETFAMRDAHEDGTGRLIPPSIAGYRAISARFRQGKVAWTMTQIKGNKWKLVDGMGLDLYGPDLLAPLVYWANDAGWIR